MSVHTTPWLHCTVHLPTPAACLASAPPLAGAAGRGRRQGGQGHSAVHLFGLQRRHRRAHRRRQPAAAPRAQPAVGHQPAAVVCVVWVGGRGGSAPAAPSPPTLVARRRQALRGRVRATLIAGYSATLPCCGMLSEGCSIEAPSCWVVCSPSRAHYVIGPCAGCSAYGPLALVTITGATGGA